MIIVSFFGGLASQMNQYAFMCELMRRFPNVSIKATVADCWSSDHQHNGFELNDVFGISLDLADRFDVMRLADYYPGYGIVAKMFNKFYAVKRIFSKSHQITINDPTVFYDDIFEIDTEKDIFFWSNYSAEEYFQSSTDIIKKSFVFKKKLDKSNQELLNKIKSCNSVSIHVRHGDYEKYGFSILPIDYYKKAISMIDDMVDQPKYFIFSDDKEYIEKAFNFLDDVVIVTNNSNENSYKDMQLMSECKHNIIANSGFSFWSAWLNNNPEKIVIAPKKHVPWCKNPLALHEWKKI